MNKNEVFSQVAALVGAGHIESERVYNAALDLALAEIGRAAPIAKSFTLGHFPPHAVYRLSAPCHVTPAAPLTVSALTAASFLAEGFGAGRLTVLCGGRLCREIDLQDGFSQLFSVKTLCGEAEAELTLLFTTEGELTLSTLTLYDREVSREQCGDALTYSASAYAPDFLAFDGRIFKNRKAIPQGEVALSGDTLTIDRRARGVYEIGYYVAPKRAEALSGEEAFCVRKEVEHLIPLLTAYYVLLEDDNGNCEAFLASYKEGLERYEQTRLRGEEFVRDLYGW